MDSDCPNTPDPRPNDQPAASKLRYDGAHPLPPAPMFARIDFDAPPEADEGG